MEIHVIRHGLTKLNKEGKVNGEIDEELAPEGLAQARAANIVIPNLKLIISSPLRRAVQTAEAINEKLKLPIEIDPGIREIEMGSLE